MNTAFKKQIGKNQQLFQLRILEDNYTYILAWGTHALVVDPGEGLPVLTLLEKENLTLKHILITHHHSDHTGGTARIQKETGCQILGPADERIPLIDHFVEEGEELLCGPFAIEVLATPGHTRPHLVYFIRELHLLFSGDLLFSGGCGRIFEGTPKEMWHSLEKLQSFPDDTAIYCGHEYTVKNLMFAREIEPENQELEAYYRQAQQRVQMGHPTIPSTLAIEKKINPFLRVQAEALRQAVEMPDADPVTVFTYVRELRDRF